MVSSNKSLSFLRLAPDDLQGVDGRRPAGSGWQGAVCCPRHPPARAPEQHIRGGAVCAGPAAASEVAAFQPPDQHREAAAGADAADPPPTEDDADRAGDAQPAAGENSRAMPHSGDPDEAYTLLFYKTDACV